MTDSDSAARHLHVIRTLMERATIYRSISAPTALVGGLLSLGGFALAWYFDGILHRPLSVDQFLVVWLVILVLTGLTNLFFLSRDASRRGDPLFSPGMKCALFSVAPAFLFAGVLTLLVMTSPLSLVLTWITLYGIGLLATQHFAPCSLVVLGATFFFTGILLFLASNYYLKWNVRLEITPVVASGLMGMTFGGFHLVYAAAVWLLGEDQTESDSPATGPENV
jgi:hypothetical protein